VPSAENLDIKQLMARLNGIREGRARLDEAERQTIQTIKRKLQEQKKALAQLELDLHQLGIALEENAPDRGPIQQAGFETMPRPAPSPEPERLGPPRIKP